ncbi:MAG: transcription termination/antitermination NusG family protein [bacterium]
MSRSVMEGASITPSGECTPRWFVVQTNPKEEERALVHLAEKGLELFFPKIRVVRFRRFKAREAIRPLFPSYLFARFHYPDEYPQVVWTRGVRRVLGTQGEPTSVPDEVISTIRSQMDSHGLVRVGRRLRPKDRVRIVSGPFKDLLGIFERDLDDQGRVEILLAVLGFQARVHLHESLIERAP